MRRRLSDAYEVIRRLSDAYGDIFKKKIIFVIFGRFKKGNPRAVGIFRRILDRNVVVLHHMNPNGDILAPIIKELRMESCRQLESFKFLLALKNAKNGSAISGRDWNVTDELVSELLAYIGYELKEISLFGCG